MQQLINPESLIMQASQLHPRVPHRASRVCPGTRQPDYLLETALPTLGSFSPGFAHIRVSAPSRRGATLLFVAAMLTLIMGLAAFAVDTGYLYTSYAQLQTCADSGSLAGAEALLSDSLVQAVPNYTVGQSSARAAAVQFASANQVGVSFPTVDPNYSNDPNGDVVIGYLADPTDPSGQMDSSNPALYNAVQVRVRRTSEMNGVVPAFFSRIWGNRGQSVAARATSVVSSSVVGFEVTEQTGNAPLLPFAMELNKWNLLVAGSGSDNYKLDSNGNVVSGSDGILETNLYPLSNGSGGSTPGNFGTVDIGSPDNSTEDLKQQLLHGVSSEDLSYLGGSLRLQSNGTLRLNGDTGISAGIKSELNSIKGTPRVVLLYSSVSGNGNNATYTVVGFAGVRIMYVQLTGPMSQKRVVIQPAIVVDDSAFIDYTTPNHSMYIYSNVRMAR